MSVNLYPYQSTADARQQYELWLKATEDLPFAWLSSQINTSHQCKLSAASSPKTRIYAKDHAGGLLGYIGIHPPFEWIGRQHGPPVADLGMCLPFGYPWTNPRNDKLAAELYSAMYSRLKELFDITKIDRLIQRFRLTWTEHIDFLQQRGWSEIDRVPLLSTTIKKDTPNIDRSQLRKLCINDSSTIENVAALATEEVAYSGFAGTGVELTEKIDAGWLSLEHFWTVDDKGAFALEIREGNACVTFFAAAPDFREQMLRLVFKTALQLGARRAYFTVPDQQAELGGWLSEMHDFECTEYGIYMQNKIADLKKGLDIASSKVGK